MTWGQGGNVPKRVKDQVRRRDRVCQIGYPGICTGAIDQFDHPIGLAEQGLRRTGIRNASEIQGVCIPCHRLKTEQQRKAGRAKVIQQRGTLSRRARDREPHPGRQG
jgi:hypothetical protein